MTRGWNREVVPALKQVESFCGTRALGEQFNMTMTPLFTWIIQFSLLAMSPSGGKQQLCVSFVLPTCVYSVPPVAGGGAAAAGFGCPGARAAAAFLAAT